jgi:hypothetical protein
VIERRAVGDGGGTLHNLYTCARTPMDALSVQSNRDVAR